MDRRTEDKPADVARAFPRRKPESNSPRDGKKRAHYNPPPSKPDADWALDWLRAHNALVRFEFDGTVSVTVRRIKRRGPLLVTAIIAVKDAVESRMRHAIEVHR
jgi:hypothetical protein